jgi:hypothetical protein
MRKASLAAIVMGVMGCDEEAKLPVGSTCDVPEACASGLCVESLCIDPVGCDDAIASGQSGPLVDACLAGLSEIVVTPGNLSVSPGGAFQFKAEGRFGSGSKGGGGIGDAALTATIDVTGLASWLGSEGVTFSSEERGLARVSANASGTQTIEAILGTGPQVEGEFDRYLRASATLVIGGEGEP